MAHDVSLYAGAALQAVEGMVRGRVGYNAQTTRKEDLTPQEESEN